MELQEMTGIPSSRSDTDIYHKHKRSISKEYIDQLDSLSKVTKIVVRPPKLNLSESPFHLRFKKLRSMSVLRQSGDQTPPSDTE